MILSSTEDLEYAYQMVIFGVIYFGFFWLVTVCFRDTANLPSAMSARELDPVKRALRLALSSWKLISLIISVTLTIVGRSYILGRSTFEFWSLFFTFGTVLSLLAFICTFKAIRLRVSLYFKIFLVLSIALDLIVLFWGQEASYLVIPEWAAFKYFTNIFVELMF